MKLKRIETATSDHYSNFRNYTSRGTAHASFSPLSRGHRLSSGTMSTPKAPEFVSPESLQNNMQVSWRLFLQSQSLTPGSATLLTLGLTTTHRLTFHCGLFAAGAAALWLYVWVLVGDRSRTTAAPSWQLCLEASLAR